MSREARVPGRSLVLRPLLDENPITLQILGICSALAVTRSLDTALIMCASVIFVLVLSSATISALRSQIPRSIRLIVQITIIATLVIVVDQLVRTFAWELSKELSVFVGLIVTNCIVLGRAEAFAMSHPLRESALDGLGNGLGYSLVLLAVATARELLGAGTLLGFTVLPLAEDGGWFVPLRLMQMPPSAFFLIGLLIWAVRSVRRRQIEPREGPAPDTAAPRSTSAWTS